MENKLQPIFEYIQKSLEKHLTELFVNQQVDIEKKILVDVHLKNILNNLMYKCLIYDYKIHIMTSESDEINYIIFITQNIIDITSTAIELKVSFKR